MIIKAKGQLRHCFFGKYSALIALVFEDASQAKQALPRLGEGWGFGDKSDKALIWSGDSNSLVECKKMLGYLGADVEKIDSVAKSVDFGEPFSIEMDVPNPKQMELFQ